MIKVSVIIPTYNNEKYIKQCLKSILNQTLKEFEILLINDGSNDNTNNVITPFLKDKRIKYYNNLNRGIGFSRNLGIDNAKGKYITFVDSDDYLNNTFLEKMYNKCENEKIDFLVCDYYEFKNSNFVKININDFKNTSLQRNPSLVNEINLGPCNKMFSAKLFYKKNNRFPENIKYEDMPLIVKLLSEAVKIGKLNQNLSYFRVHKNSESTTVDKKVFDIFKSLDLTNEVLKTQKEYEEASEHLNVLKITTYNIQQKYQKNKKYRNKFIDQGFSYLDFNFPNWRNSKYFNNNSRLKKIIKTNKTFTKLYCAFYNNLLFR